ncbi:GATA zinc finger domain-containing protein 14-like [Argonauta hians]
MGPTMVMKLAFVICVLYIGVDTVYGKGVRLSKREAEVFRNLNTESNGRRVKKAVKDVIELNPQGKDPNKSHERLLMYAKRMYESRSPLVKKQPQIQNKDKPEPILIRSKRRDLDHPEVSGHIPANEKRLNPRDHSKNAGHHHNSHNKNVQHRMKGKGNLHKKDLKLAQDPSFQIEQKRAKMATLKKKSDVSRRVNGKKNDHKGKRDDSKKHHNNDHHKKMKAFKKINKKKHDEHKSEHHYKNGHNHEKAKSYKKWKNHDKSGFHKNKSNKKHASHKSQDVTIVKRKDIKF